MTERPHNKRVKESIARGIQEQVEEQGATLKRIEVALLGDEFRPEGVVQKVDKNYQKIEETAAKVEELRNERDYAVKGAKILGGFFGGGSILWVFWEKLKHLF